MIGTKHCPQTGRRRFWKEGFLVLSMIYCYCLSGAQTPVEILQLVKARLDRVNDYAATGKMKTNVAFIKAPIANVKIYYSRPDKLRIVNESGISFIPKGAVNINMNNVLVNIDAYDVIDGGRDKDGLRVLKLLPKQENADVVLSTLYIDEKNMLIRRSKTTTRENGTYELSMSYGKFASYGLPDRVHFSFNTSDYKLPKGITLDYDDGSKKQDDALKKKNGSVEIDYSGYIINKGVDGKLFERN